MKKLKNTVFIFDVDSTIVKTETLDDIIGVAIKDGGAKNDNDAKLKKEEIDKIMHLGMNGKIEFKESLERRFNVVQILSGHIKYYNEEVLPKYIDFKFKEIIKFIKNNGGSSYIVSAGFMDSINVVAKNLKVDKKYCFANEFIKKDKKVLGFNKTNPLINSDGKIRVAKKIKKEHSHKKIICIGDGNSDWLIKREKMADEFWGFWANVRRENLAKKADRNFYSSKELLEFINLMGAA